MLLVRAVQAENAALNSTERCADDTRLELLPSYVVREPKMIELYALVDRLARGSINVLVLGETGVGKEIVAEAVHQASPRRDGPLVRINCAALAEPLLESELFGHERGAFTGAISAKPGLIEVAHGGTVFLDEVGELPLALQAKLLRVIEAREVTRVGSVRPRPVDVRFVSATNRNPQAAVEGGSFRADLLYRLKGASLHVPPLRERPLEIVPMAEAFVLRVASQVQLARVPRLTSEAKARLLTHGWRGNVRELRNVLERAVLTCDGCVIDSADLSLDSAFPVALSDATSPFAPNAPLSTGDIGCQLPGERERIVGALLECGGNQSRAAELLGMARRTLVRRIAQLGLPRPRSSSGSKIMAGMPRAARRDNLGSSKL